MDWEIEAWCDKQESMNEDIEFYSTKNLRDLYDTKQEMIKYTPFFPMPITNIILNYILDWRIEPEKMLMDRDIISLVEENKIRKRNILCIWCGDSYRNNLINILIDSHRNYIVMCNECLDVKNRGEDYLRSLFLEDYKTYNLRSIINCGMIVKINSKFDEFDRLTVYYKLSNKLLITFTGGLIGYS